MSFSFPESETRAGAQISFGLIFQTIWFGAAEGQKFIKLNNHHQVVCAGAAGGQLHLIKSMTAETSDSCRGEKKPHKTVGFLIWLHYRRSSPLYHTLQTDNVRLHVGLNWEMCFTTEFPAVGKVLAAVSESQPIKV